MIESSKQRNNHLASQSQQAVSSFDTDAIKIQKDCLYCSRQVYLYIEESKLELITNEFVKKIRKNSDWIAPLSLLASFIFTLTTSNFHDFLNIQSSFWEHSTILSSVGVSVWLLFACMNYYKNKNIDAKYFVKLVKESCDQNSSDLIHSSENRERKIPDQKDENGYTITMIPSDSDK